MEVAQIAIADCSWTWKITIGYGNNLKKNNTMLTDGLHWFHQTHSFVVDCTTLSVVDAVVQQLCLVYQIALIEAAVLTVGLCQPDVTELLLPFHSDDVIIWTFYQIDTFSQKFTVSRIFFYSLIFFIDFFWKDNCCSSFLWDFFFLYQKTQKL